MELFLNEAAILAHRCASHTRIEALWDIEGVGVCLNRLVGLTQLARVVACSSREQPVARSWLLLDRARWAR
jgi:hypothetical protein